MSSLNLSMNDFIKPFTNKTQYLKAIFIINSFSSLNSSNLISIKTCLKSILQIDLNIQETKKFIDKITLYGKDSGLNFIQSIDELQLSFDTYVLEKGEALLTITASVNSCVYCLNSNPHWYQFYNPILSKQPSIYTANKISKPYYNYFKNKQT
jgi:hypothetical protein